MAFPDYNQILNNIWGWGNEKSAAWSYLSLASNILMGTNPPYSAADFYEFFPSFGGTPAVFSGLLDGSTNIVRNVSDFTSLAMGQTITGTGIPGGTVITDVDEEDQTLTLSQNTTIAGLNVMITVYVNPVVPLPVLNAYIYLATNSIMQVRYQEMWAYCMALYIAHYCTLWLQGQAGGSGPAQVAAAGLAMGINTSKSVGDVSTGSAPLGVFEDWGTYALTIYGQELATFAMAIGSGNMLLW